jgi:hypothetical protein
LRILFICWYFFKILRQFFFWITCSMSIFYFRLIFIIIGLFLFKNLLLLFLFFLGFIYTFFFFTCLFATLRIFFKFICFILFFFSQILIIFNLLIIFLNIFKNLRIHINLLYFLNTLSVKIIFISIYKKCVLFFFKII